MSNDIDCLDAIPTKDFLELAAQTAEEDGVSPVAQRFRAIAASYEWRDARTTTPPLGKCVEVWGDGEGNVHLAAFDDGRWLDWSPFQDERGDQRLPFEPTHWRPLREGEP